MSLNDHRTHPDIPVLTRTINGSGKEHTPAKTIPPILHDVLSPPPILDTTHNEAAWNDLEYRLTARILHQVQERTHFMLESSIQQGMTTILQEATKKIITEIKNDLESTLEVVIAHSVSEEILRLHKRELSLQENASSKMDKNSNTEPQATFHRISI